MVGNPRLSLVSPPAVEPISLESAKHYLRETDDAQNDVVRQAIRAARRRIETVTGRQLISAGYTLKFDNPPSERYIELPRPPLISVSAGTYIDLAGATQTWSTSLYQVDAPTGPHADRGRLAPIYGSDWPPIRPETFNSFVVAFTAGYGTTAEAIPEDLLQALLKVLAGYYVHRGDEAIALPVPPEVSAFKVY